MNIPQEELNAWVEKTARINGCLLSVIYALRDGNAEKALPTVETAQQITAALWRTLEHNGAESPLPDFMKAAIESRETPLHLLDTPANRKYARLLRETLEALREVERERGIQDGSSEVMECELAAVEMELFGPAGRGERL